jgi:hypothetical protein
LIGRINLPFTLKITEKPGSRLAGSHSDPACSQTSFINIDPDTVISHPSPPNSIASFLSISLTFHSPLPPSIKKTEKKQVHTAI